MIQSVKEILPRILSAFENPELRKKTTLWDQWGEIVGSKIASHTKPTLNFKGELCVWVDESTLAFELSQKYRQALLKRVQTVLGETAVKSIRFRVGQLR